MRRWLSISFLFLGLLFLFQCTPPVTNPDGNQGDGGTGDSKPQCITPRDCEKTEDCRGGKCVAAKKCEKYWDCKKSQVCFEGRCVEKCELDTDCPAQHVCVNGVCHQPNWKAGKPANDGSTDRKPLKAGLGVVEMDFPLSVSTAGYGFRFGPKGPYAKVLGASTGVWDRFYVKVIALDDGVKRLFLLRTSMCFIPDFLRTQVVQYVIKETGMDVSKGLFITANHTHSGPGRFWNLLPGKGFGSLGYGNFLPEVFMRLVKSFGDAIIAANKDLQPAKFGYKVEPNFDPDGKIFSDRRSANAPYRNPHLVVMRVDKANGDPMAVLVNFGMHGIVAPFDDFHLTQDSGGGVELVLQKRLENKYKKRIETFFMQGSAGDISPRGGHQGHSATQRMQMLGYLTSLVVEKMVADIKTSSDIKVDYAHKRVGLSRNLIGYSKEQFFRVRAGEKTIYRYGAFKCVEKPAYKHDSGKSHKDGDFRCLMDMEQTNDGAPVPQFSKTHLSVARIGGLFIGAFPGESSSHLARRLREDLVKESGGKIKDIATFGYSQDHQFYILGKDDWLRGGYEASMHVWGYLFGEYIFKHVKNLTLSLLDEKREEKSSGFLPMDFYGLKMAITIPREQTPNAGTIVKQPAKVYYRVSQKPQSFTVSGGWVGIDHPRVVLQKKEGGEFKDVKNAAGRPLSDDGHQIIMDFTQSKKDWHYNYHFEALQDFPLGTYRFRVRGYKWEGDKKVAYETNTEEFEIKAYENLWIRGVKLTKDGLQGYVGYPPSSNDDGKTPFDKIKRLGQLMRSPLVRWEILKPIADKAAVKLTVELSKDGKEIQKWDEKALNWYGKADVISVKARLKDGKEVTQVHKDSLVSGFKYKNKAPLAAGKYKLTISFTDEHGNKGSWSKELEIK